MASMKRTRKSPADIAEGGQIDENFEICEGAADSATAGLDNVGAESSGGNHDLKRLIRLLTNEDTADIAQRQLVVLRQVCKVRQKGFRYGELALVERLLPLLENKILAGPHTSKFRGSLRKLVNICSIAPVRDHASQEFTECGLTASSSLFGVLGRLLWSPDASIQSTTADVLKKIAAGNDPSRPNTPDDKKKLRFGECRDDLRPKPKDINQALLLGCGVVRSAVACLGTVISDVLASLRELTEGASTASSSFDDYYIENQDTSGEGFQSNSGVEADDVPSADNGEFDDTGGDLDSSDEVDSTATRADEAQLRMDDTEIGGEDSGTDVGRNPSNLAMKQAVLLSLLQLVRELSTDANSSAAMVGEGLVTLLVQVLQAVQGIRDPTLSITIEVMWNCLEHSQNAMENGPPARSRTSLIRKARKTNAAFALSSWSGVSALRNVLEALFIGGFRKKDKELRNEVVIVASQLSSNVRSHPLFRNTGLLLLLLRYATAVETGLADGNPLAAESEARTFSVADAEGSYISRSGCKGDGSSSSPERTGAPQLGPLADPRNFATIKEVDMELKLLLWSLLTDLCKRDARNVEVVNASPLMETLLMYMDLVIEEGHGCDTPLPGMTRSISLASMPPMGSQQTTHFAGIGSSPSTFPPDGRGDTLPRHPRADGSEVEKGNHTSAASLSGNATTSGDTVLQNFSDVAHTTGRKSDEMSVPSGQRVSDDASKSPGRARRASAGGEGVEDTPEFNGLTQLFVPASVFRLPVTSIQLLQGQAIASLLVLAPKCPRKFQALGGHMVTLRLLDRLGNRPDNQRLVKAATKMLATVVSLPGLKEELGRVDGVRIMLNRFSDEWKRDQPGGVSSGTRASSVASGGGSGGGGGCESEGISDVRTDMVIILCRLCEECLENQEAFRKADGVPIMMTAVKAYCRARSEAKQQESAGSGRGGDSSAVVGAGASGGPSSGLSSCAGGMRSSGSDGENLNPSLVHIIDCVWCAVVGNRRSEARLLQCEGLDTLLDLLELCPVFMRHQVTGVVADLLRNKRSIPYARAWRSDLNMLSITQLMVRLWVSEESRLGVSRPNGVLQNLWEPLQSHDRGCGRRCSNKTPARRVRSSPTSGDGVVRDSNSTTSGAGSVAADVRSSSSPASGRGSANIAALRDGAAKTISSAGTPNGDAFLVPSTSETGSVSTPQATTGDGASTQHESNQCGVSLAVALALDAGKRVVSEQGSGVGARGRRKRVSHDSAEASVAKAMANLDLRGKIAAVLGMVGFDGSTTDGLGPSDLKASYMASSYMDFREGEAWQRVAAELDAQHINPIAADALVLDSKLERAFDCAQEVKSKQMALTVEQEAREGEEEEAYFAGIIFQRDQEIRQAIIKRNALLPGGSKKRLAVKKAQTKMIKRGSTKSHRESSDAGTGSDHGALEDDFGNKDTAVAKNPSIEKTSTTIAAAG